MAATALLLFLTLASASARADEATPEPVPEAPVEDEAAPAPEPVPEAPVEAQAEPTVPTPAVPSFTPEQVARLQRYKARRMEIRDETEIRGGAAAVTMAPPSTVVSPSTGVVVVDPIFTVQTWGVYQGGTRLPPVAVLRETGETFRADDVAARIERDRKKARRWMMVAGVGAASLATGIIRYDRATNLPEQLLAQQLTLGGTAASLTGLLGASFPANRATHLARYPSAVMDRADAETLVSQYNATLATELGLTPEERMLLELAEDL